MEILKHHAGMKSTIRPSSRWKVRAFIERLSLKSLAGTRTALTIGCRCLRCLSSPHPPPKPQKAARPKQNERTKINYPSTSHPAGARFLMLWRWLEEQIKVKRLDEGELAAAQQQPKIAPDSAHRYEPGWVDYFRPGGDKRTSVGAEHRYVSTACQHGKHERCRLACKFCGTACVCGCGHQQKQTAIEKLKARRFEVEDAEPPACPICGDYCSCGGKGAPTVEPSPSAEATGSGEANPK
jgi:hypothetical protein